MEASVMGVSQVAWTLTIAGTDRTAWIQKRTLRGDWSRNGFASLTFSTFDVKIGAAAYRPNVDQEVIFTVTGVVRFRGFIAEVGDTPLGGIRSGTRCAIKCTDASSLLDRVTVQDEHDYTGNPLPILWSLPEQVVTDIPAIPPGNIAVRLHAPHGWTTGTVVRIEGHTNMPPDGSINGDHVITVPPHGPLTGVTDGNYWIASTFYFPGTQVSQGGQGTARATFTTKAIISDLVATYLTPNYGITLDSAMATGPIMEPLSLMGSTVNEALKQITGSMGWLYRMLPTHVLEIFAPGTKLASFNLDGSNTHAAVQWQRSRQRFTNRIVLYAGGDQKVIATETFMTTGAASATYTLGYDVSQDINDTWPAELIVDGVVTNPVGWGPGNLPSPSWYWDYVASPACLVQEAGTVPLAAGRVITVTYTRQFPLKVIAEDATDVQPYPVGHGPWEEVVEAPGVTDKGAAQALAINLLTQKFKIVGPRELQTGTLAGYAYPGDALTLTFPDRIVSGTWFVDAVAWSFWGKGILYYEYTFVEGTSVTGNWITDFQQLLATGGGGGSAATTVLTGSSGVGGGTGGGGGGGGTGTDEVFIGPNDPGTALELWYDSDAPAPDTTIPDHSITLAKLIQVPSQTVLGRQTAALGDIEVLTVLPTNVQNQITRLGTVTAGVWNATAIGLNYLAGAGAAGTFVRSNGTNWATSTLTLPNTSTFTRVVYSTSPNTYGDSANLTFDGSNLRLVGNETVSGFIGSPTYGSQTTGWRIDSLGGADFRYLFVDEMHAKSFITDLEMALAGGQIISKSVAMVAVPFNVPGLGGSSPLYVRDLPSMADVAAFQDGDMIVLRRFSRTGGSLNIADCVGTVYGWVDQVDGTQGWTFYRNNGAEGGTMSGGQVSVDSLALDYGVSGNGYYEVNAIDGAYAANSPYAQVVTWTNAPTGNNKTIRARFGNLRGITGVTNEYGLIAGTYVAQSGSYLRASNTTFELHNIVATWWSGFTPVVQISHGNGSPYISLGNPMYPAVGQGPGIVLAFNSGANLAQFWCYSSNSNYLVFDGNILYWRTPNTILDTAGNLTATSASLSGAITATSGKIYGDLEVGSAGQIRSGAFGYGAGIGWWLDYNGGAPRFRVGNPNADRLAWDNGVLIIRSGKFIIDGSASGHIGMGAAPYSIATLNIASDTDDANSYGLLVTNHAGTVATLLTYGDGRLFLGGQLYILPGAWSTEGAGRNPPSIWNGPFGTHELSGWMQIYMYTGGGGIPPTGPYSRGWIPIWLG